MCFCGVGVVAWRRRLQAELDAVMGRVSKDVRTLRGKMDAAAADVQELREASAAASRQVH